MSDLRRMLIYHIVLPEVWSEFGSEKLYAAESLHTEGFIHCSFAEQLDGVIARYYSDAGSIFVLTIDTEMLASRLVIEPSTNDELYPHIYGPINRDSVIAVESRDV